MVAKNTKNKNKRTASTTVAELKNQKKEQGVAEFENHLSDNTGLVDPNQMTFDEIASTNENTNTKGIETEMAKKTNTTVTAEKKDENLTVVEPVVEVSTTETVADPNTSTVDHSEEVTPTVTDEKDTNPTATTDDDDSEDNNEEDEGELSPELKGKKLGDLAEESTKAKTKKKETEKKVFAKKRALDGFRHNLDFNTVEPTIDEVYSDYKKGLIDTSIAIQRNYVWKPTQKAWLIHSLFYGFDVPPVYVQMKYDEATGKTTKYILDGKQRLTTIFDFLDDNLVLHKSTPTLNEGTEFEIKLGGKKFSQLREDEQTLFKFKTKLLFRQSLNISESERDEQFIRLNNGSALNAFEYTRSLYSPLMKQVDKEITDKNKFFEGTIQLNTNRFAHTEALFQYFLVREKGDDVGGLGSNQIRAFVNKHKKKSTILPEEIVKTMRELTGEYLYEAFKNDDAEDLKELLKKNNLPMIMASGEKAMNEGIPATWFAEFVKDFIGKTHTTADKNNKPIIRQDEYTEYRGDYNDSVQGGTAGSSNVKKRYNATMKAFEVFYKKYRFANNLDRNKKYYTVISNEGLVWAEQPSKEEIEMFVKEGYTLIEGTGKEAKEKASAIRVKWLQDNPIKDETKEEKKEDKKEDKKLVKQVKVGKEDKKDTKQSTTKIAK
jgi:hypothetical protein